MCQIVVLIYAHLYEYLFLFYSDIREDCYFTDHYCNMYFFVHGSSNLNDNSLPCLPRNLQHAYHLVLCCVRLFPVVLCFMHSLSNLLLSFFTACKIFLYIKNAPSFLSFRFFCEENTESLEYSPDIYCVLL
jgi:hypothetical protein